MGSGAVDKLINTNALKLSILKRIKRQKIGDCPYFYIAFFLIKSIKSSTCVKASATTVSAAP